MNDPARLIAFATRYAQAWCSQSGDKVAAFYAEKGSLTVNNGPPAVGRRAIAEVARGFMCDFPDMIVRMDKIVATGDGTRFHWTLVGTNSCPGGTGNLVRISGYEVWRFDDEGLIAESKGRYDAAEYERQLKKVQ